MSNNGSNAGHASLIDVEESSSAVSSGPSADGKPSAGGKSQKKSPKQMTGRKSALLAAAALLIAIGAGYLTSVKDHTNQ